MIVHYRSVLSTSTMDLSSKMYHWNYDNSHEKSLANMKTNSSPVTWTDTTDHKYQMHVSQKIWHLRNIVIVVTIYAYRVKDHYLQRLYCTKYRIFASDKNMCEALLYTWQSWGFTQHMSRCIFFTCFVNRFPRRFRAARATYSRAAHL